MNHLDCCTHIQFPEDYDILTRPNFDVNLRLLRVNPDYRRIIEAVVAHVLACATVKKEGYPQPKGWSGANAGIPFNVIAYDVGNGKVDYMINPRIAKRSGEYRVVMSNCGSLTLPKKKQVFRHEFIDVEYFDLDGEKKQMLDIPPTPGFTLQHEIQHTKGVLI